MRALITGAEGFAGGHLVRYLQAQAPDWTLYGTARFADEPPAWLGEALAEMHVIDLRDSDVVRDLLDHVRPDYVFHLAAQAFVPRSFEEPWETLENNIRSQLNLLQGSLTLGIRPRMLVVSSAEVYGDVPAEQMPITEEFLLRPTNPYSVSKVAQDMLGLQYHLSHDLPVVRVRPFNHIGPNQRPDFVAPAFAMQVARIERGLLPPVIQVGNLSARRDFTDVRDVVRAYHVAITRGQPGAVYNVCSGNAHSIQELLDILLGYSTVSVEVRIDPARLRPVDRPLVVGSAARLHADTGWQPAISVADSLRDVLETCRVRVAQEPA
ncbi:MAG: GDP-mannose 4,6-dehydratase [Anaerolineae bacterium]|nr:GDP-mannose 4,6-dehydratase [Anaerolineae bacterium]